MRDKDWKTIEPQVRDTWETHNKGTRERFKDAIREGFDLDKSSSFEERHGPGPWSFLFEIGAT